MTNKKKYAIGKNPNSHKPTKEANAKRSESLKQKHKEKEWGFIEGSTPHNKDKSHMSGIPRHNYDESFKEKIKNNMLKRYADGWQVWNKGIVGKDSHMWQDGVSFEPYGIEFNDELREQIRERDNHTCQECKHTENRLGYKLSIHHIDYDKRNNQKSNLISLCKSCHAKTNWDRENWKIYYEEKIGGNRNE